ncbi:family 1 glycosylhydrolase [Kutzneria kofuensis]|uniref:Beta-glucosidase n=1 Tax=Kutzneria kofuensis TaxID=103725 RepID=A0A7W9KL16_9PSEU|nr:family 1 glycosylhydrolase [Kutzneria kofuensis]MBB5894417.1 beta-glucosidase [Kutzneria kofuensis]
MGRSRTVAATADGCWDTFAGFGRPAYRFPVAWAGVQPEGRGPVSRACLAFYDRLVDRLLDKGVTPIATLYQWDLPQSLDEAGGWTNRETALRFAEYTTAVHAALADRVRLWTTLDEPSRAAFLGHAHDAVAALRSAHHLLLGHGLTVAAIRERAPEHEVSIVLNLTTVVVDRDDQPHTAAFRRVDGLRNRFFLDPLFGRGYPVDVLADTAWLGPWDDVVLDGDSDLIAEPVNWYGVTYYGPTRVVPVEDPFTVTGGGHPGLRGVRLLAPQFGEDIGESFAELMLRLSIDYPELPLMVTENTAHHPAAVAV